MSPPTTGRGKSDCGQQLIIGSRGIQQSVPPGRRRESRARRDNALSQIPHVRGYAALERRIFVRKLHEKTAENGLVPLVISIVVWCRLGSARWDQTTIPCHNIRHAVADPDDAGLTVAEAARFTDVNAEGPKLFGEFR
jgi:hypothetical protein